MAYTMNKDIWRTRGMAKGGMNRKIMEMVVSTDSTEERNEEEKKKLDYHGAMEAALKSMYDDAYDSMVTQSGKKLGEEVPYLDLLILKKDPSLRLNDEIGSFFKENNVIENKGYTDGISINDVFKVQAYAGMYMVLDRKVDEIPWETVTVTVIQFKYPRAAFQRLMEMGCVIKERVQGSVWEVSGPPVMFPFQVVNAVNLGEEWSVIKIMSPGATEEAILKVQRDYEQTNDPRKKQHLGIVLKLSLMNNKETAKKMEETGVMTNEMIETARYLFADEFEAEAKKHAEDLEAEKKKHEEDLESDKTQTIQNMLLDKVKISNIEKWTGASPKKIIEIAKALGMTSLSL